jgi:hypothetical protein
VEDGAILVSMADLSDDLATVPAMMAAWAEGADVVVASRYVAGGRQLGGPWLKGQLSRWGGRSLRWVAGFPACDASNGFRLFDAGLVRRITFESSGGFALGFEITIKAWMAGARIAEVPTTWRDRTAGESRFDLRKWLPCYARLWGRALAYGVLRRVRHGAALSLGLARGSNGAEGRGSSPREGGESCGCNPNVRRARA